MSITISVRILLTLAASWTCGAQPTNPNLAATVLAYANFQNPDGARLMLTRSLERASLVVQATVTKTDTAVNASPAQTAVSTGQGWNAVIVKPTRVLKGTNTATGLIIENLFRNTSGAIKHCPLEVTNGQSCVLILEPNINLSLWCQTNVYSVVPQMEVK